jgi:hypothetical protein
MIDSRFHLILGFMEYSAKSSENKGLDSRIKTAVNKVKRTIFLVDINPPAF